MYKLVLNSIFDNCQLMEKTNLGKSVIAVRGNLPTLTSLDPPGLFANRHLACWKKTTLAHRALPQVVTGHLRIGLRVRPFTFRVP